MKHSESEDSPFQRTSTVESSRGDYYREVLDRNVIAPLRILVRDKRGLFGIVTISFFIFVGTVGAWLYPEPVATGPILQGPFESMEYPLGTDRYGNGILAMLIHSTPFMLLMILGGAVYNIIMAVVVGTFSGYKGGKIDEFLMLISDAVIAVPALPLVIVLAVVFEPRNPILVGIVITMPRWAGLSRALRSEVLSVRQQSYIEASRAMGVPTPSILRNEIIPNLMPYIMINMVNAARGVIFASVGLYYLGILPSSGIMNWGVMMNQAFGLGAMYSLDTAHWLIFPMAVVVLLAYGLIMFGQASDRIFNPRLRARHAKTVEEDETL